MKLFHARIFNYAEDAETVKAWCAERKFPLPQESLLSNIGFMVENIVCGFLYTTSSKVGFIQWVFSNPDKSSEDRREAFEMLFTLIDRTAKELGIEILFSDSSVQSYATVLEKSGFAVAEKNLSRYYKKIGD